jgi:hypothetical protein
MLTFIKFTKKSIQTLALLFIICLVSGCAAQKKHHRAVPCPCEKRK